MFDLADIYGHGLSERLFGDSIQKLGIRRDSFYIQTKCGIRRRDDPVRGFPHRYDFSYNHIISSVEGSLRRLRTDYIDVLLLHRPDALLDIDDVALAFDELNRSGKVNFFGASNHNIGQLELLRRNCRQPLLCNQVQLNLKCIGLIESGLVVNEDKKAFGTEGLLDYCRLHKITVQAWSPLAEGRALGEEGDSLNRLIFEMSEKYDVQPAAIPIAWLLRHPAGIQRIIGTTRPERIEGISAADRIELTREDWYSILTEACGERLP